MPIVNSGSSVLVSGGTVKTVADFTNAAASNIKWIDSLAFVTSNAAGGATNGTIIMGVEAGNTLNFNSAKTLVVNQAPGCSPSGYTATANGMYIDLSNATMIVTTSTAVAFPAPMKMNAQSKLISAGCVLWSAVHSGTQIDGANFIADGADTNGATLGWHPSGYVRNIKLTSTATTAQNWIMGVVPVWTGQTGADKVVPFDGLKLESIKGNKAITFFTWNYSIVPWSGGWNNGFMIYRDMEYNVGYSDRLTAVQRSYRRGNLASNAASLWAGATLTTTYLWVDTYTTLNAAGVLTPGSKTYIVKADYVNIGASGSDVTVDLFALRFSPKVMTPVGEAISDVAVSVINTNALATGTNPSLTRSRLAASGTTGADGKIVITEPATKDYNTYASIRTDSICVRNRVKTDAYHKFWEAGTKYIVIGDSTGSVGLTFGDVWGASDFTARYRKAGRVFQTEVLDMSAPVIKNVPLLPDSNYNSSQSVSGVTISYAAGVTTATVASGDQSLDAIYKAVIDYHGTIENTEAGTVVPISQNNDGKITFGSSLVLSLASGTTLVGGSNVNTLNPASSISVYGLRDVAVEGAISQATPTNMTGVSITGNLTYNSASNVTITLTGCTISGTVSNSGAGTVTINLSEGSTVGTAGTRVVVKNTKIFAWSVTDTSGNPVTDYEYRIYVKSSTAGYIGSSELAGSELFSSSTGTYEYEYATDVQIAFQVIKTGYTEGLAYFTLGNTNQAVTVTVGIDNGL